MGITVPMDTSTSHFLHSWLLEEELFLFFKSWNNSGHFCEVVFPTNNCTHLAAKHGNVNGDVEIKEEMFKGFLPHHKKPTGN